MQATEQAAKRPLRITSVQAKDFKRVVSAEIMPGLRTLIVLQGPNEAGKTSAIEAVIAALGGKRRSPEVPIRKGQEFASVEVELSDEIAARYRIVRSWKGDDTWLSVYTIGDDGSRSKVSAGQTELDSLVSDVSFSPLAFANASDRKLQMRMLCHAIGRPDLIDAAEQKKAAISEQRRQVNQEASTLKARLESELTDPAPGQDLREVTAEGVKARLDAAERQNHARQSADIQLEALRTSHTKGVNAIAELDRQIKELQEKRAAYAGKLQTIEAEITKLDLSIRAMPPEVSTAELTSQLQQIAADNARCEKQKAHRAGLAKLNTLGAQINEFNRQLEAIDGQVETTITASDLGKAVPGLSFKDGALLHNGVPFAQASGMRRLELSALIGMAANPRLRIMTIDEGDQLDDESLKRLKELAASRGFQLWMTAIRAGDANDPDTWVVPVRDGKADAKIPQESKPAIAATPTPAPVSTQPGWTSVAPAAAPAAASPAFDFDDI